MLKVVLVDDEEIIRDGILRCLSWEELGFQVAGQAEDGELALQVIEDTRPDVIITDIKMPFMDGLELIERIKPLYPATYIIIISGHEEFRYAQKAIKLGAYDYILKPIEPEYLKSVLINIRHDDLQQKQTAAEIDRMKAKISENLPLLQEFFFKSLVRGKIQPDSLDAKLEELQIEFRGNFYGAAIIQSDDYCTPTPGDGESADQPDSTFINTIMEAGKKQPAVIIFDNNPGEAVILAAAADQGTLDKKLKIIFAETRSKMDENCGSTITIAVGGDYGPMLNLAKSYSEALEALNYKFILGKNRDIYFNELDKAPKNEFEALTDYDEAEIITAIKLADQKQIKEKMGWLLSKMQSQGIHSSLYMQLVAGNLYLQALKILKDAGGSPEEIFNDPFTVYHKIIARQTLKDMHNELLNVLFRITDFINIKKFKRFYQVIEKAKDYLQKNYAKDDLSLEEAAQYVNMSSCYFSYIFRQETGLNFIDFLTKTRLERAKELLALSDSKSYEVSYQVGYNNPTYFSTLFKKYFGVTPTEYKNGLKNRKE